MPCYEILLETGERLVATAEHQWLIERPGSSVQWATTESLHWSQHHKVRRRPIRLARYVDLWEPSDTNRGGYLRGLYDGEGSVRKRREHGGSFNGVSLSQKDETVLSEARSALAAEGFSFNDRLASDGVTNLEIGTRDGIRLLGQIRPQRLVNKWNALMWPRLTAREWVRVVGVRPVREQEVVTLTTSTKTFLAEGFGSHNTEIMAEMIRRLACRSLIIVASRDLARQTIRRFQGTDREAAHLAFPNADPEHLYGIVGDDVESPGLITAALYQTLVRRLMPVCLRCGAAGELDQRTCDVKKGLRRCSGELDFTESEVTREWLATFDALHLDECHRSTAKTWWPVVNCIPAYWRFGYSATPTKSDPITELKLTGATGEIFYSFKAKEAIEEGWLTEPFVVTVAPKFPLLDDEEMRYIDVYRDGIADHVKRNRLIAEIAQGTSEGWGVPTLILVAWSEQGRNIKRALREIDVRAEFISGTDSTEKRLAVMEALQDGRITCAISTTIFDEGVNVPEIGALILAGGGKARHKVIQRIGRGLRVVEGKDYLAVFDIWDSHSDKYLVGHSKQRLQAVKDAGFPQETLTPKALMARIRKGDVRGSNG
jgi:superfamily II DNA or RNA helicase